MPYQKGNTLCRKAEAYVRISIESTVPIKLAEVIYEEIPLVVWKQMAKFEIHIRNDGIVVMCKREMEKEIRETHLSHLFPAGTDDITFEYTD